MTDRPVPEESADKPSGASEDQLRPPNVKDPDKRLRDIRQGEVITKTRGDLLAKSGLEKILDPKTLKAVLARLEPLIDIEPVETGTMVDPRIVDAKAFQAIARSVAVSASGLDPSAPPASTLVVVWDDGDAELAVLVGAVRTKLGDGLVDVEIPVECDETGRATVVVTIVTAHPKRPFGTILATNNRPNGPRIVVDRWSEGLIALAWEIVSESANLIAASVGRDRDNRPLAVSSIFASPQGLTVVPIADHTFTKRLNLGKSG